MAKRRRTEYDEAEDRVRNNPFLFYFICAAICAVMYMFAFHDKRDDYNELKEKYEECAGIKLDQ